MKNDTRSLTIHWIMILLMTSLTTWAQQQPADITGNISVTAPVNVNSLDDDDPPPQFESFELIDDALATLSVDYTHTRTQPESMESTYTAFADIFGGLRPQVQVAATSSATSSDPEYILNARSAAQGELTYEVMVVQTSPPPLTFFPPLSLYADMRAEVSYTGAADNNAQAYAMVYVSNPVRPRNAQRRIQLSVSEEGSDSQAIRWGFKAIAGDPIRVILRARADSKLRAASDTAPAILSSEAMAIADPYFGFDQEQFDLDMADWGLETFNIADFYDITYSDRLLESMPDLIFSGSFDQTP